MKKRGRKRSEATVRSTSILQSVEKTLDVLELLSQHRSIGITELAAALKIGTSSTHRILSTLKKKEFAAQDPDTGRYALGHMIFQLARSVIHMIEPVKYMRPHLEKVCRKIGENVAFGVVAPGKDRTLILAEEISEKPIIASSILFKRFPLHVCPCGKAYLLGLDSARLKRTLSRIHLQRYTKHTPVSLSDLNKQLGRFRKLGYTVSRDEYALGLTGIGVAIADGKDHFAGAIMITGPSFRFTNRNIQIWAKLLLHSAAKIGLELRAKGVD